MCGIAGAAGFVDETVRDAVIRSNRYQSHRGPDGDGLWENRGNGTSGVVFAHRRLAVIDLNVISNQPMLDPETGIVIVYNGEVYNFQELRAELEANGYSFRTNSDTEVVIKSYARWGTDCLNKLRGMFAFAIYDPKEEHVFLVRDRIGIKPLYYSFLDNSGDHKTLIFASELRALLATEKIGRRIDPVGLSTYLWNGFVAEPSTIIKGVNRLEAGHYLLLSLRSGRVEKKSYWQMPGPGTKIDHAGKFEEILQETVRMHLVSDVPVGIFLSGGVDSSTLAALATRSASQQICTFNISFEETKFDESSYARRVAEEIGAKHTEIRLSADNFKAGLSDALGCLDQPTFDGINTYFVSRAVREAGVTVALAGTGGDELFGGYNSFREIGRMQSASRIAHFFPDFLVQAAAQGISRYKFGKYGLVSPQTRWGKLGEILSKNGRLFDLYQLSYALFLPDFVREITKEKYPTGCLSGLPQKKAAELEKLIAGYPSLHATSCMEFTCFLGGRLLPDTDTASMATSLEVRVPLLDHVLIEYVASLHEKQRFYPLGQKQMLRQSVRNDFDQTILERPKSGFELPLAAWCQQELQGQIMELFSDRSACEAVGLNQTVVMRLWTAFRQNAPGLYWSRIWAIFVLLWWSKKYKVSL